MRRSNCDGHWPCSPLPPGEPHQCCSSPSRNHALNIARRTSLRKRPDRSPHRRQGKTPSRPGELDGEPLPVEGRSGVLLAPGGDMLMPDHVLDGIARTQFVQQLEQDAVLGRRKRLALEALELDADGKVVAVVALLEARSARVPGTVLA